MSFLSILSGLTSLINAASAILPVVAAARKQADPSVSNAGLENTTKIIQIVTPLVQAGEAVSAAGVAAGQPALTGAQKLAIAQDSVAQAHALVQAAGGTTHTFDEYWVPINAAISAICAVSKTNPEIAFLGQPTA
jgi:hypothetical protein